MTQVLTVDMDVLSELTSAIVERQWNLTHATPHSYADESGDLHYVEEADNEFNRVLDLIDNILNPEV